ncbi:hypothetical protein [Spirosoma endophyticum]|uniref:Immunity protein 26 n=1 Tax=Spirosoma endophyticum TaxID=662367 RepID=A0A1I1SRT7_9BACT|nr:hypothetical protein [Spirosoma endophyticum]SFD46633.1 hypothetical protein SAMN05216167_105133 [Spirosoma endophyticum]
MEENSLFSVGDYVKYTGSTRTLGLPPRSQYIGKIEEIETRLGEQVCNISLVDSDARIWARFREIEKLRTSPELLKSIGFVESEMKGGKLYFLGDICVSGMMINIGFPRNNYIVDTGYCNVNFVYEKEKINVEKYLVNGNFGSEFSLKLFYKDYPSVYYFNDLLVLLSEEGIDVDVEDALKNI